MSNILEVRFEEGQTFATATRLWKGDYGQILLIHGPALPAYYEVHFASTKADAPQIQVGTPEGVLIPNKFLQTDGYIYAWTFLHTGGNDGETKYQIKIPVEDKGIPIDQETPEEKTAVQQAVEALNKQTGVATKAAASAEESAQRAEEAAASIDEGMIADAVAGYLDDHPITVDETDPTVPEWAKQPTKPTYTAAEVGALPDTYTPLVDESLSEISTNPVQNKVVSAKLFEVESIAKGRATGYVFETESEMRAWISSNAGSLKIGDNLYIRATDVPDYWWDGTAAQPLETQKVDLTEYAKKSEVPALDTTLTVSGQAADAKATGDAIRSISEEIANLQTSGLTTAQINALDGMFKVAAYDDSKDVSGAYAAFKAAFGLVDSGDTGGGGEETPDVTTYTITAELVNVTSSNSAASITEGASYTATLTADDGYKLDTVSILMGGVDVTANVYADGIISIASVTGNVEIMASASIIASEAEMVTSGLLAYWDFRAKEMANTFAPTIGDESKYRVDAVNTWDMTADWFHTQGFDCGNGPYGGVTIKEADDAGTFSTMNHGTVFTVAMIWFSPLDQSYFGFSEYYTNNGVYKTSRAKDTYVDGDGNNQNGKLVTIDYINKADTYHTLIVRVNGDALSVYFDGTEYINDSGANYDGFDHWKSTLTIRAIKSYNAGYLTAMAMYNRALDDTEIVEMTEWLKTLEVSA